jgi:hypothetical protein
MEKAVANLKEAGLSVISGKYPNYDTAKFVVKCSGDDEHIYELTYDNFMRQRKCLYCSRGMVDNTMSTINKQLSEMGLSCSDDVLTANIKNRLTFDCKHGHQMTKTLEAVLKLPTCTICKNNEMLHKAAASHGGTCLSSEFTSTKDKYIWKCSNPDHPEWSVQLTYVYNSRTDAPKKWCPLCAKDNLNTAGK